MKRFSPVKYLYQLSDLIDREHGVAVKDRWQEQGLALPEDASEFVDEQTFRKACETAVQCVNDPALGLKFGNTITLTHFGPLGAAMMSCETLADVLNLASEYSGTFLPFDLEMIEHRDAVRITPNFRDLQSPFSIFNMLVVAAGSIRLLNEVAGFVPRGIIVHFPFSKPDAALFKVYQHYAPVAMQFDAKSSIVSIPKSCLKDPLPRHDEVSKKLFVKICQDIQKRLGKNEELTAYILQLLDTYDTYPTIEQIAQKLNVPARTLRYHLKKERTSYRKILGFHRLQRAAHLLRSSKLPIELISEKVGYYDTSSFYRAFKKEIGSTPAEYRSQH